MRVDGTMLMTCKEQNRARLRNILAAAFSGNEGSGYKVRTARSCLLVCDAVLCGAVVLAADRTSLSNYGVREWLQH